MMEDNNNNNTAGENTENDEQSTSSEEVVDNERSKASSPPPPPVLRGRLFYDLDRRRHMIRGMWNYEEDSTTTTFPPLQPPPQLQRFEWQRHITPEEDPTELPKDGEFHGSFWLPYIHMTSKGKKTERSKLVPESGVNIKFTEINNNNEEDRIYQVEGQGTNQFGIFHIDGTATLSQHGDGEYDVVLRKRYIERNDRFPSGPQQ